MSQPPSESPTGSETPTGSGSRTVGTVTVYGRVVAGVEQGCRLLEGYLLVGGDRDKLRPGALVTVTGRTNKDLVTTCQQGIPLVVSTITPAA